MLNANSFFSEPPNKGFSSMHCMQIVMAGARVAQIKIVRGAECTSLIRKFQCFVASASPPSPRSRATRRQRRRLEAVRCTDVVTVRPFEQLQLALAPGARGVIGPNFGFCVHYLVTFYYHT